MKDQGNQFNGIGTQASFVEKYQIVPAVDAGWKQHAQTHGITARPAKGSKQSGGSYNSKKWTWIQDNFSGVWASYREHRAYRSFLSSTGFIHGSPGDKTDDEEDAVADDDADDRGAQHLEAGARDQFSMYREYCNAAVVFSTPNLSSSTVANANASVGRLYMYKKPSQWLPAAGASYCCSA